MSDDQDRDEPQTPEESQQIPTPSTQFPEPPEWNYKRKQQKPKASTQKSNSYSGVAIGVKYGYMVVGPMVGGWIIGLLIENNTDVKDAQMWGLIIGIGMGLFTLILTINKSPEKK